MPPHSLFIMVRVMKRRNKDFAGTVRKRGADQVAQDVGISIRYVQMLLKGDRRASRPLLERLHRAYSDFSADRDIEATAAGDA